MNVLYEIAIDDRISLETRYEAARKMQQNKPKGLKLVTVPKRKRKPKKDVTTKPTAELIKKEIGDDLFLYIVNHYGKQERSVTAKKTGIPKYRLNAYYVALYGSKEGA